MSVLNRRDTKKLVQPQLIPWSAPADAPNWLDDSQTVCLGAVALLGVVAKSAEAFTRIELIEDGFTVSCGQAAGHENCDLKPNWRLWAMLANDGFVMVSSAVKPSFDQFLATEPALLVRRRAWGVGLTRKSRDANRHYATRRPTVLKNADGVPTPYLRYVHIGESESDEVVSVSSDKTWFWEARYAPLGADARGRHRTLLLADGIATADGLVAYGPELLTLYRTWAAIMLAADPSARFETLFVRLPGTPVPSASEAAHAGAGQMTTPAGAAVQATGATSDTGIEHGTTSSSDAVCSVCGGGLRGNARFCTHCGKAV